MAKVNIFALSEAAKLLPQRDPTDNKTKGGKCLVIAGSDQFWGASILTAKAAARMGAGYVYLLTEAKIKHLSENPDIILKQDLKAEELQAFSAIAIGPGLTNVGFIEKYLLLATKSVETKSVLDAGALNFIAQSDQEFKFHHNTVMTPHEGEMGRLLGVTAEEIRKDRLRFAQQAQKKYACTLLLKGHQTLVVSDKGVSQIEAGNVALAKAGTGDVLTGMITGLLSQGLNVTDAATLAAYVHGYMADEWVQKGKDQIALLASDLIDALPQTLAQIRASLKTSS